MEAALTAREIVDPGELPGLREEAEGEGLDLVRFLLRSGRVSEQAMQEVQAGVYGLERLGAIAEADVDPEAVLRFPISYLKRHAVVPLTGPGGVRLAMADPANLPLAQDVRTVLGGPAPAPVLAPEAAILEVVNRVFGETKETAEVSDLLGSEQDWNMDALNEDALEDLLDDSSDAPLIKLVNMVLTQAVRAGASDVHVEPYKDVVRIRFRLDGVLYDKHSFSKRYHAALVSRIKVMAKLNIAQKRMPQDGRIALVLGGRQVDLRVSVLPTSHGERVVLRLLEKSSRVLSMSELGLSDDHLRKIKELSGISHGIILVTGPTGSGKTTTLYAVLSHINSPDKNILTIEDPVEYQLDGVGQMQVNQKLGLTFAQGLRSIVRQDPDVILIGEIRDKETADIAIQSALTGHLVFSTLHTNDAPSAVTRLVDMGVEPFLLSSVLRAVVAQRLVRVLCPHCREAYEVDQAALSEFDLDPAQLSGGTFYRPVGCPQCMNTGYKGRKAIYELMPVSEAVKNQILQSADSNQLRHRVVAEGMRTLTGDGCLKALRGITSLTEVSRVTNL